MGNLGKNTVDGLMDEGAARLAGAIAEMQRRGCFTRPLELHEQLLRVEGEGPDREIFGCLPLGVLDGAIARTGNIDLYGYYDKAEDAWVVELSASREHQMEGPLWDHFDDLWDMRIQFSPVGFFGVMESGRFRAGLSLVCPFEWKDLYRGMLLVSAGDAYVDALVWDGNEPAHVVEAFRKYGYEGDWVKEAERSIRAYRGKWQAICNVFLPANLALLQSYGLLDQVAEAAKAAPSDGWPLFTTYALYADAIAEILAEDLDLSPLQVGAVLWADQEIYDTRYSRAALEKLKEKAQNSRFSGEDAEAWARYNTFSAERILESHL